MAIGALKRANVRSKEKGLVSIAAPKGTWITVNSDARSAQSSGELLAPATIAGATFHWLKVPENVTKVLIRGKYPAGTSVIVTSPIVRPMGAYENGGEISDAGVCPNDGTVPPLRLDNASHSATGLTCTLSVSNDVSDGTFKYGAVTSIAGYSILGADYIGVMVSTAAAITSSAAVEIQVLLV